MKFEVEVELVRVCQAGGINPGPWNFDRWVGRCYTAVELDPEMDRSGERVLDGWSTGGCVRGDDGGRGSDEVGGETL